MEASTEGLLVMELKIPDTDKLILREALEKAIKDIDREITFSGNWKERVVLEKRKEILKVVLAEIPDVMEIAA